MGFLRWLFEPFNDLNEEFIDSVSEGLAERLRSDVEEEVQDALKEGLATGQFVRLQPGDYTHPLHVETPPTVFRPTTFSEYIGQSSAKKILQKFVTGTKQRGVVFPHTLIHGSAGCGKTTLVKIISSQLKTHCVETITSDITDFESLKNKIFEAKSGVLFLDEIHGLDRGNAEKLYTIMEDFTYNGVAIPRFTLIGATTELGEIIQNRRPFYDRFKIILELEPYAIKDLAKIAAQYQKNMFPQEKFPSDIYTIIAQNSRSTPRTAIRLMEATIYFNGEVNEVLKSFQIIKDGFTNTDLKLLKYMKTSDTAVGMQSIASYLGTSVANYTFAIEPYLLSTGMIVRTPRGRKLTEKAYSLIEELEQENGRLIQEV